MAHFLLSWEEPYRSDLKPARISSEKSFGCSQAAKSALVEPVVMNEFGLRPLCPIPRSWIQLVRRHAHGNRDGDAFDTEE